MDHTEISKKESSGQAVDQASSRVKDKMIVIDKRYQGPPKSGNGGYVCGLVSQFVDGPAARVRLLRPAPLDTELEVRETNGGVVLLDGDVVLAEARPEKVMYEPPYVPELRRGGGSISPLPGIHVTLVPLVLCMRSGQA